jgi:hypothetical protein
MGDYDRLVRIRKTRKHSEFWWGNLLKTGYLEDRRVGMEPLRFCGVGCEDGKWMGFGISVVEPSGSAIREFVYEV